MRIYRTDRRRSEKSILGKTRRQRKTRRRPLVEPLERRNLLASITVTSLDDTVVDDGQITLREAIQAANTDTSVDGSPAGNGPDEILFASGLTGPITLGGSRLEITDDLTITGPGSDVLGVDGNAASQILFTSGSIDVTISGLVFYRGSGVRGGAIENADANLTITDSVIQQNSSSEAGGGLYNDTGTLTVIDSLIGGSSQSDGNSADGGGGGIYNNLGTLSLIRTTVSSNLTVGSGGGVHNDAGNLSVLDSTFFQNSVETGDGGSLWNGGTATVTDSSVSNNTAGGNGGGLYNNGGMLSVTHSTIVDNRGDSNGDGDSGGGVATRDDVSALTHLFNTIVAGNTTGSVSSITASDIAGKNVESGSANNLIGDPLSTAGLTEGTAGNLVGDGSGSLLPRSQIVGGRAANHAGGPLTHALVPGSRAIDGGDSSFATTAGDDGLPGTSDNGETALLGDQRGAPFDRIDGASVDIGSYELQVYDDSHFIVNTTADVLDFEADVSLREALIAADENPGADTITFGGTIFTDQVADTITLGSELAFGGDVAIVGPGALLLTVSGGNASRIFRISGSDVNLSGLTLTQGREAILNSANLTISDSRIVGNSSDGFGSGGGVDNSGTLTILRSTIANNSSSAFGGGIINRDTLTIISSTISGNSSGVGGGIFNDGDGTITITLSTISGNTASDLGGGVFNNRGSVLISSSTIVGNRSNPAGSDTSPGGGVFNRLDNSTSLHLFNTIVAGNVDGQVGSDTPSDVEGKPAEADSANNLIGTEMGGLRLDQIIDPVLADNGGNTLTHALVPLSPAIDAGDGSLLPADSSDVDDDLDTSEPLPLDQRGAVRVVDQVGVSNAADGLDIGAFELEPMALPAVIVEVSPNGPDGAPDPNDLAGGPQPTSWSQQRSDIREIIVRLKSSASSATANDVVLTNLGIDAPADPDVAVPLTDSQLSLSPDGLVVTISFAANQLDDGVYQLDLLSGITGGDTFTITGDAINKLYVMTGDWNGSGGINIQDFATFAYWFGNSVPTAPDYVDVNDSGGINIQDFAGFAANFGKSITFPTAPAPLNAGTSGEGELVTAVDALVVIDRLGEQSGAPVPTLAAEQRAQETNHPLPAESPAFILDTAALSEVAGAVTDEGDPVDLALNEINSESRQRSDAEAEPLDAVIELLSQQRSV